MTDREAIEFLGYKAKRAHPCDIKYYDRAISALQEREERNKGCEHCNNKVVPFGEGGAHDFRILGNAIYYYDEVFGWEGVEIELCPWCGRPLKGEEK